MAGRRRANEWLDPEGERRRALRRWIFASAFAHGVALVALAWAPSPRTVELPGVISVELVAMAAPAAPAPRRAPTPPPAPRAEPSKPLPEPQTAPPKPPEPPPPPRREAVLPKTPQQKPEQKKPRAKPEPDPKPEPVAEKPKPAPRPPPVEQERYEDVLAQLRAERGETRPERVDRAAAWRAAAEAAAQGGGARGPALPVPPEVAGWLRAARIHVRQAWVLPAGFRRENLETHVLVELDARGNVLSEPRVTQRSGNPWYDESVVRAVQKASPLPPPPEPGAWPFVFRPEDLG